MFADHRLAPVQSIVVQRHHDMRHFLMHRQRVLDIKPVIDTKQPKTFMLLQNNGKTKKIQIEEDRLRDIDRENRRLLKSLVTISNRESIKQKRSKSINYTNRIQHSMFRSAQPSETTTSITEHRQIPLSRASSLSSILQW